MKLPLLTLLVVVYGLSAFAQVPKIEPGVSKDLAVWRATHYSDIRYKLNLTLEKMSPVLKGTIEIRVNVSPGAQASPPATSPGGVITPIVLDWRKIPGHEKDSTISNVVVNGKKAFFERPKLTVEGVTRYYANINEHLIFYDNVVAGENVIKLDFTSPILTSGSAITRYIDKEDGSEYIYALFGRDDASTAFSVFDQPDLKARFELVVKPPRDWSVISNSEASTHHHVAFSTAEYTITQDFNETKPITLYFFAFAAGPFAASLERDRKDVIDEILDEKGGLIQTPENVTDAEIRSRTMYAFVRQSQASKFERRFRDIFKTQRERIKKLEVKKQSLYKYDIVLVPKPLSSRVTAVNDDYLRESGIIFMPESSVFK